MRSLVLAVLLFWFACLKVIRLAELHVDAGTRVCVSYCGLEARGNSAACSIADVPCIMKHHLNDTLHTFLHQNYALLAYMSPT